MNKTQWIVILAAAILFIVFYFGFDTQPAEHRAVEDQRKLALVSTDINNLLSAAKKKLDSHQVQELAAIEQELKMASSDSVKARVLEQLSRTWYNFEKAGIAGHYAEEIAKKLGTEEAWSITGTTYSICIQRETEEKVKKLLHRKSRCRLRKRRIFGPL